MELAVVEEVEPAEEPDLRLGISFFGDEDDPICKRVWDIYMRDSIERGFATDTKKRGELAPELAAIQPRMEEEEMTMVEKLRVKRGALLESVAAAHNDYRAKHGREPTPKELFAVIGAVGKNPANVGMAMRRAKKNGLLGGNGAPAPKVERKARTIVDISNGASKVKAKSNGMAHAHGDDALVAGLVERRNFHADKVAALTIAIEALGGGGVGAAMKKDATS